MLKKRKNKIKNSPVLHQLHSAGNAHVSASLQRQKRTYGKKGREFHQSRHWGLFGCFTVRSSPGTRPPVPSRRGKHNTNHNAYQQQSQTRALSEQTGNNETLSRMPTWRDSMEVTWWNWKLKDKQRRHGKQQKGRKQVSSSRRAAITSMDGRREWIYTTPQMVILRLMCCNMAPVKLKGDTSLCSREKGTWLQPWSYIHGVTPDVITLTSEQTWHLSNWHYSQAFVPALKKKKKRLTFLRTWQFTHVPNGCSLAPTTGKEDLMLDLKADISTLPESERAPSFISLSCFSNNLLVLRRRK